MIGPVLHVPRPARLAGAVTARLQPTAIPAAVVDEVLRAHGLTATGSARTLALGRRSHNVVVPTDGGRVVVKQYRADWTAARVVHVHDVLDHLAAVGSPAPTLRRRLDGGTWTTTGDRRFAVLDLVPGRNLSLDWLRREDRLRAAMVAGRVLARLHLDLDGVEPRGEHHLGFTSLTGPARFPIGWYLERLSDLERAPVDGDASGRADVPSLARLAGRADELADRLATLDRRLRPAALPRVVVHGDFGLHNLVFTGPDRALPVDFELARIDWRLTDLVLAIGRFGPDRTTWSIPAVAAFLAPYTRRCPLTRAELALLPEVWAFVRLAAGVRAWDAYARGGQPRHRHAVDAALGEVDWLDRHPEALQRVVAMATVASGPPTASRGRPWGRATSA